jgi:transposase
MKSQECKNEFIRLRAEGKSYSHIASVLNISKATCTSWERELKGQITELKREQLNDLYDDYHMTRENRIRRLGDTLSMIETALASVDLVLVSPEKLLDYKLKYVAALKEEMLDLTPPRRLEDNFTSKDILNTLGDLLSRVQAGDVSAAQAGREVAVIGNLLKAYDLIKLQTKLEALDMVLGGRV